MQKGGTTYQEAGRRGSNPHDRLYRGGGIRILMDRVTRDYLIAHRLSPTQCTPNMFRILGSVDAFNERMNVNLSHHDVN